MKTRRQQKHEMLITFMANAKPSKRPTRSKPGILKSLLSLFL